jgi:hypothetical protein
VAQQNGTFRHNDAAAVLKAVREFDALGRDAFLARYGFGEARQYFLALAGSRWNSNRRRGPCSKEWATWSGSRSRSELQRIFQSPPARRCIVSLFLCQLVPVWISRFKARIIRN